jgi:hypothetical protein
MENCLSFRYSGFASGNILRNSPDGKGGLFSSGFFSSFFTTCGVGIAALGGSVGGNGWPGVFPGN